MTELDTFTRQVLSDAFIFMGKIESIPFNDRYIHAPPTIGRFAEELNLEANVETKMHEL